MEISELYKHFLECGCVTTDTRNCPEGSMFFALKGASFNGNAFASKALENGCRYAVVDEAEYAQTDNDRIILVDDCLKALQNMAALHRKTLGTKMIGITGTNGKTTTKELIAAVLKEKFNVLYTEGNLNNHIGVPLTLLKLTKAHEMAVVEMGANHPGEIKFLVNIAQPDYGIITNVGKAHLEGFGSFEGVIHTKGELYEYIRNHNGSIFIQNENKYLNSIATGIDCIRYGSDKNLEVSGRIISCSPFLNFSWTADGKEHEVHTHLIGSYNLDNALAAVTIGRHFGVEDESICHALSSYIPKNNRSQLVDTGKNKLVVDAYNANPTSMKAALENFRLIEASHKMVIIGDMKELGESSIEEHQNIVDMLSDCGFEKVVLVGPEFGKTCNNFIHYNNANEVKEAIISNTPEGYMILIKGSNSMKLAGLANIL